MKNLKSTIAIVLTALIAVSSVGLITSCSQSNTESKAETTAVTEAATEAQTEAETAAAVETKISDKLIDLASRDGATGYTCCKLKGSKNYFLVVAKGDSEAEKVLSFYKIGADDVEYSGELSGSHTVAYIDKETATLGLFTAHMGEYKYGLVSVKGEVSFNEDEKGTVGEGEDYPAVPGEKITFTKPSNVEQLYNFD